MTRLIDADKLYPDCMTKNGTLAISQSQLADAQTIPLPDFKEGYKQAILDGKTNYSSIICGNCKYVDVARNRKPCCACKWLERESYYEEDSND